MAEKQKDNDSQIMLRQSFDAYDVNKNGTIAISDLSALCQSLGVQIGDQELAAQIDAIDVKEDGSITWDEFLKLAAELFTERLTAWMNAFRKFDVNHDGFITTNELQAAMKDLKAIEMSDSAVHAFIGEVDEDNDGRINYKEFMKSALTWMLFDDDGALK